AARTSGSTSSAEKRIFVVTLLTVAGFAFGPAQLRAASLPPAPTVLQHDDQPRVQLTGWREQLERAKSENPECRGAWQKCRIACGWTAEGLNTISGGRCQGECDKRKVYWLKGQSW